MPTTITARRILLATGVSDIFLLLPGFRELWGRGGELHCPYCHGWEVRGQPLVVYGRGRTVTSLALLVSRWSADVVVVTDGPGNLTPNARRRLRRQKIDIWEEPVARLIGSAELGLRCVKFADGRALERAALFLHAPQHQRTLLTWVPVSLAGARCGSMPACKPPSPAFTPLATPNPVPNKPCSPLSMAPARPLPSTKA